MKTVIFENDITERLNERLWCRVSAAKLLSMLTNNYKISNNISNLKSTQIKEKVKSIWNKETKNKWKCWCFWKDYK